MTFRVPYRSDDAIERDAEALLAQFAHARGVEVKAPVPIEDIVEKHLKLRVEFDDLHRLLGVPLEPDIFGAIWLETGEIVIDESLDPEERPAMEGRYRFTLGQALSRCQIDHATNLLARQAHAAAATSRHVCRADALKARCVLAEVR